MSTIDIRFDAVPNARPNSGWLPAIWVNGRRRGDSWACTGYDRDEALVLAEKDAREEAARFVGDWTITVERRA